MRNAGETAIDFVESVADCTPAVYVGRRFVAPGNFGEWHAFAKDFTCGFPRLFPGKVGRVVCWVDVGQPTPSLAGGAHFTFMTTSVRSSERGALCENQSTSFRTRSAISAAEIS